MINFRLCSGTGPTSTGNSGEGGGLLNSLRKSAFLKKSKGFLYTRSNHQLLREHHALQSQSRLYIQNSSFTYSKLLNVLYCRREDKIFLAAIIAFVKDRIFAFTQASIKYHIFVTRLIMYRPAIISFFFWHVIDPTHQACSVPLCWTSTATWDVTVSVK